MYRQILLYLVILVILSTPSFAFDKWSNTDKTLQLTYTILYIADWKQTRQIAQQPNIYYEKNPILGPHPSVGEVNTYMFTTLLLHTAVTHILPQKYRKYWQSVWIWREADAVSGNHGIGLKIEF